MKSQQAFEKGTRPYYETQYKIARINLIAMLAFTVIGIFMSIFTESYLLFSAFLPLNMGVLAYYSFSGVYAAELVEFEGLSPLDAQAYANMFGAVCLTICVVALVLFLLCWIFSKKHYGWFAVALVLFIVDTLYLALGFDLSFVIDLLFHAWVIYYLIMGIIAGRKLKTMPIEEAAEEPIAEAAEGTAESAEDTWDALVQNTESSGQDDTQ